MIAGRNTIKLLALVLIGGLLMPGFSWSEGAAMEPTSLPVIEPDGENDTIGVAHDYATDVWQDPWDMGQAADTYRTIGFGNEKFENGIFSGLTTSNDAYFWLLHQGYPDAHNAGRTGLVQPIDSGLYRQLTFKLYRDLDNPNVPVRLYWYQAGDEVSGQPCGVTKPIPPFVGWHVYTLDLSNPANWGSTRTCNWSGQITGLRMDPTSTSNSAIKNVTVKVDWVRLTDPTSDVPYTVEWNMNGDVITLDLDEDNSRTNGTLLTIAPALDTADMAYTWPGAGLPPGDYWVQARSGSDYASLVRGNAWDMLQTSDVVATYNIGSLNYSNSIMSFTSTSNDPYFFLAIPSDALVDGSRFHQAVLRLQSSALVGGNYMFLYWRCAGQSSWNQSAVIETSTSWATYSLDLGNPQNVEQGAWCGAEGVAEFRIDPAVANGAQIKVDWVALTTGATPDGEGDLAPEYGTSLGPLRLNQAPLCILTAPSMTSGPDYATTVLGNAWDMNDAADVGTFMNVTDHTFTNGILDGTTKGVSSGWGDPQLWLHTSDDLAKYINTDKYRYLTYRYWQEGVQQVGNGWVMRYLWTPTNFGSIVTTLQDVITLDGWASYTAADGWHSYSVDLETAAIEAGSGWNGWQHYFRFDPTESPTSQRFHLDYVLLTANDEADAQFNIKWQCSDSNGDDLTITLYADRDNRGYDGILLTSLANPPDAAAQSSAPPVEAAEPFEGEYKLFLPFLMAHGGPEPCTGQCYTWPTEQIAAGSYYVYAVVSDGYNTIKFYSETPVEISH